MQMRQIPKEPSLLTKLGVMVGGSILLVLGVMFSVVLLAGIAIVGLLAWGYFRWKTRHLRKAMKKQARSSAGTVIEGEAIVVEEYPAAPDNHHPLRPPQS